MKRHTTVALLLASGMLAGCYPSITAVRLSPPPGPTARKEPKGIPYYLPRLYLVVTKNVRYIPTPTIGLTQTVAIPAQFDGSFGNTPPKESGGTDGNGTGRQGGTGNDTGTGTGTGTGNRNGTGTGNGTGNDTGNGTNNGSHGSGTGTGTDSHGSGPGTRGHGASGAGGTTNSLFPDTSDAPLRLIAALADAQQLAQATDNASSNALAGGTPATNTSGDTTGHANPTGAAPTTASTDKPGNATPPQNTQLFGPPEYFVVPQASIPDGLTPQTFYTYQFIYLPDYDEKYGLRIHGGSGEFRATFNLVNGWMFTGPGPLYQRDSSTQQNINAAGDMASSLAKAIIGAVVPSPAGAVNAATSALGKANHTGDVNEHSTATQPANLQQIPRYAEIYVFQSPKSAAEMADPAMWKCVVHKTFGRDILPTTTATPGPIPSSNDNAKAELLKIEYPGDGSPNLKVSKVSQQDSSLIVTLEPVGAPPTHPVPLKDVTEFINQQLSPPVKWDYDMKSVESLSAKGYLTP
jgi:hypothetical protein